MVDEALTSIYNFNVGSVPWNKLLLLLLPSIFFPVHQSVSSLVRCHETYEAEEMSLNEIRNK